MVWDPGIQKKLPYKTCAYTPNAKYASECFVHNLLVWGRRSVNISHSIMVFLIEIISPGTGIQGFILFM